MKTRLKQRRGAITVMTALIFLSLVTCMAIAVDFSRLWTVRNELQTSADAAALSGAMQFIGTRDSLRYVDSATAYARRNYTLGDTIRVDSVQKGSWNSTARTFTPNANPSDAVNVVVSYLPSRMWMRAFGSTVPRMKARAVAWVAAPVADPPECVKPWAMPYETLMFAINNFRGITNTNANLNRAFDQVNDLQALNQMTATQRTFTLKMAQNSNANNGQVTQSGATVTSMPGNFQAVRLGKYWDYATQQIASPGPQNGGNAYANWINGTNGCPNIAVGDSLQVETGNKVGPTLNNISPAVCQSVINTPSNLTTHGNCLNTAGTVGVDIVSAFFSCGSGCSGQSTVGVKLTGAFTMKKIYPNGAGGPNPAYDRSQIVGEFKPQQSMGPAGGSSTTLVKLVLAK